MYISVHVNWLVSLSGCFKVVAHICIFKSATFIHLHFNFLLSLELVVPLSGLFPENSLTQLAKFCAFIAISNQPYPWLGYLKDLVGSWSLILILNKLGSKDLFSNYLDHNRQEQSKNNQKGQTLIPQMNKFQG